MKTKKFQIKKITGKKAVLKTLEALVASLLIVLFVAFVIPSNVRVNTEEPVGVLDSLRENQEFRHCVVNYNTTCVDAFIKEFLPSEYKTNYKFIVTKDPAKIPDALLNTQLLNENTYISTDENVHDEYIVRLYYWQKTP